LSNIEKELSVYIVFTLFYKAPTLPESFTYGLNHVQINSEFLSRYSLVKKNYCIVLSKVIDGVQALFASQIETRRNPQNLKL